VTIAVHIAVFSPTVARAAIMQSHLGVEPPNQNLKQLVMLNANTLFTRIQSQNSAAVTHNIYTPITV
jgi:hypothetical protein